MLPMKLKTKECPSRTLKLVQLCLYILVQLCLYILQVLVCSIAPDKGTFFYAPAIFNDGGEHIVSLLSVRPFCPSVYPMSNTNGFSAISFEKIGVLD